MWLTNTNFLITQGRTLPWVSTLPTSPHLSTGYLALYSRERLRVFHVFMFPFTSTIPSLNHFTLLIVYSRQSGESRTHLKILKIVVLNLQFNCSQVLSAIKHQNTVSQVFCHFKTGGSYFFQHLVMCSSCTPRVLTGVPYHPYFYQHVFRII